MGVYFGFVLIHVCLCPRQSCTHDPIEGGVYPVLVPRNTVGSTQHLLFLRNIVVLAQHITAGLRCFYATWAWGMPFMHGFMQDVHSLSCVRLGMLASVCATVIK
jgi:hypothetical protein